MDEIRCEDVKIRSWELVSYEGEKFIGRVLDKKEGVFIGDRYHECNVRCLENPFGITLPQEFERGIPMWLTHVYETSIVPWITNKIVDGENCRREMWAYSM